MSSIVSAEILYVEAERMGLKPKKLTSYGVFSIHIDGKTGYLFDGRTVLNDQMAAYCADNKHVTRIILKRHNLPNIPFLLPDSLSEARDFLQIHGSVIVKPTLGSHTRNVYLVNSEEKLARRKLSAAILEKYIDGIEMRYLVLDGVVLAVHERQHLGAINSKKNVRRISYPESEWNQEMVTVAIKAASALGLRFAAVDYLVTEAKQHYILEVNSAPGIAWFHEPSEGPAVNVARLIIEKTIEQVRQTGETSAR